MTKINPHYLSWKKRLFDVVLSSLLMVLFIPVYLIIGLLVAITSGLPILFKQKRTGLNGKSFIIYKFRTMKRNAPLIRYKYKKYNEAPEPMFKIHNDPRFVGFGKFLSVSGLDELPQLANIIRGEMSFVGPRPLPVDEAKNLPKSWRSFREKVRPGVFSKWTLAEQRHSDLKKWKNLEEQTIKLTMGKQVGLVIEMVLYLLKKVFKISK